MSRLYDRMMASKNFASYLWGQPLIVADQVSEAYSDPLWEGINGWSSPQCFPPLQDLFIEARAYNTQSYCYGLVCKTFDLEEKNARRELVSRSYTDLSLAGMVRAVRESGAERIAVLCPFVEFQKNKGTTDAFAIAALGFNHDKSILPTDNGSRIAYTRAFNFAKDEAEKWEIVTYILGLFLFAFSLMNCKNVELIDNPPPPKLSRAHEKKYGQPLVTYKTIKINPMRTVKRPTNLDAPPQQKQEVQSDHPLSIWRGHFKDYRDGKGLFGKLKGVYWWDQHVRGDIENGITIKDYEVQAPKERTE